MISSVQFTGNPAKKGIKVVQNAVDSYVASRKNINIAEDAMMESRKESAAMVRKPMGNVTSEGDVLDIHPSIVERENSYARSFGVPEDVISPKKVEAELNIIDDALADSTANTKITDSIDYIA